MRFVCRKFAREIKDKEILALREKIFGTARGLTGERFFARPLVGKQFRKWYFPSKYTLQNFRVDEYFDMQAERFKPRPVHPGITDFQETLKRVRDNSDAVKAFLTQLTKEEIIAKPAYQDLHAIYMLLNDESPVGRDEKEVDDEVTFLLEVVRAQCGSSVALKVAEKANGLPMAQARAVLLQALKEDHPPEEVTKPVDLSEKLLNEEDKQYLARRHRFVDPLQRRRRLKWMERLIIGKHSANEMKNHGYYKTHPDDREMFPTNMGPVSIKWPSPHH